MDAAGGAPPLSIVIPCYEEAERVPSALEQIAAFLEAHSLRAEIVVVDDGSTDGTAETAERCAAELGLSLRVLRNAPNRGKGFAIRRGALEARGDACLLTDADLSVAIEHLAPFLARLSPGVDAVIGSRHVEGARISVHQPRFRELLGTVFRALAKRMLALEASDFTCGFKLYTRDAARRIFARQTIWGWGYDVEILLIGARLGLTTVEEPVEWRDDARTRVRLGRDVARSLRDLLQIRWNDVRGRYSE